MRSLYAALAFSIAITLTGCDLLQDDDDRIGFGALEFPGAEVRPTEAPLHTIRLGESVPIKVYVTGTEPLADASFVLTRYRNSGREGGKYVLFEADLPLETGLKRATIDATVKLLNQLDIRAEGDTLYVGFRIRQTSKCGSPSCRAGFSYPVFVLPKEQ